MGREERRDHERRRDIHRLIIKKVLINTLHTKYQTNKNGKITYLGTKKTLDKFF